MSDFVRGQELMVIKGPYSGTIVKVLCKNKSYDSGDNAFDFINTEDFYTVDLNGVQYQFSEFHLQRLNVRNFIKGD